MLKDAWMLAIETLSWMAMRRLNERTALARTMKQLGIEDYDAARLAHRLVSETVRRQNFIDAFINRAINPAIIGEYTLGVQAFLRLYTYQTRAAKNWVRLDVAEAERIAKLGRSILGWEVLQAVEPVLGVLLTQDPSLALIGRSDEERIGLLTFHPTWYVEYCFRLFSRNATLDMLKADAQQPSIYIRLNTLKAEEHQILEKLAEEGVETQQVEELKHAYRIVAAKQPLTRMRSFREGLFYVQDKASCFAVEAANPQPGTAVLEVCAAPGAKTTHIAQLMRNRGIIYSVDYSKRRMSVWKNEAYRMGVEIAEPLIADARMSLPFTVDADLIILDPPCTSTGVFRKSPSDKWRLEPRSICGMASIQWQLINTCAEKVKPGGTLVYSTCSLAVEENEMIVERFLKWHLDFSLTEMTPKIGLPGLRGLEKCQRLYPHVHDCNGFFIARLSKEHL